MTTAGPIYPSTATSSGGGTSAWINPDNVKVADSAYAEYDAETGDSENLDLAYSPGIPGTATVDGIEIIVNKRERVGADNIFDTTAQLMKSGSVVGTNKASGTEWPSAFADVTYGGPTDKWGTTWTAAEVNSLVFRFKGAQSSGPNASAVGRVENARLNVYYTAAAGGAKCALVGSVGPSTQIIGGLLVH